jgi:lipoprotein signal peptidase
MKINNPSQLLIFWRALGYTIDMLRPKRLPNDTSSPKDLIRQFARLNIADSTISQFASLTIAEMFEKLTGEKL